MKTSTKVLITVLSLLLVGIIIFVIVYTSMKPTDKSYTYLIQEIEKTTEDKDGNIISDCPIGEIHLSNDTASIVYKGEKKVKYIVYVRDTRLLDVIDAFNEGKAPEDQIVLVLNNRYAVNISDYIVPALGLILLVVLMIFMFRTMNNTNKQAMDFGRTKTQKQDQLKIRFSDVAGAEEEKEELKEIVEFLKNPQKFTAGGARVPHGVLLVGPPGTGKTLFAKAVAGEANVPFFSKSGSDFVEMFVGVGASRVRDLFEQAKKNAPCIVFIDEIDAVGRQRGAGMGGGNDEREQTLNQLLVAMDGFESDEHIIVMAATNRSDVLDPALMRPGRFDRQVYVNLPDVRGREAILKVHARNKPLASDVDFKRIAQITIGFSGADLENMLNESAILAARDNRTRISMDDIFEAIDKVEMGPPKKSRHVTPFDQRITAYHEAGHAIVSCKTKGCDPVQEVTIIPRGNAGGFTMYRPENDGNFNTVSKLTGKLASLMGGRAAEEIIIGDYTMGAVGDIQQATNIARKMVTEFGMSSLVGTVNYGGGQEVFLGRDYQTQHSYSETVATQIDAEIKRFIDEGHQTAVKVLTENRKILDTMARVLIECETIYSEEVEMIINGASPDEVKAALGERLKNKAERKVEMEKAPVQKLSDMDVIKRPETNAAPPRTDNRAKTDAVENAAEKPDDVDKPTDASDITGTTNIDNTVGKAAAPRKKPIKRVDDKDDDKKSK